MCLPNWGLFLPQQVFVLDTLNVKLSSYILDTEWFLMYFHSPSFPCRANSSNSIKKKSYQSILLILSIASLYCLWCSIQIYWINPRRPAVGEEADLGVLVFLALYFFLPYSLCIMSMYPKDHDTNQIPL